LCIILLSSRTLHMTPGVQESRQDHNKNKPKYQPVEDECDMFSNYSNLWKKPSSNEHITQCRFIFHHWIVPNLYVCVCMTEYLDQGVCRIKQSTVMSHDLPYVYILHYQHLVGYQLVSITSNFTHKRSCKRSTQHNVINRRTSLHSLVKDIGVLYPFLLVTL